MSDKPNVGGVMVVHNGVELDYCFEASALSLLKICSEVVVVEADSTDGTKMVLERLQENHSHLKIVSAEWNPVSHMTWDIDWMRDLSNLGLDHIKAPYYIYAQADEVFHEEDAHLIYDAAKRNVQIYVHRLNFWGDFFHLAPPPQVCSHLCIRGSPRQYGLAKYASTIIPSQTVEHSKVRLAHYGFMRNSAGFSKKSNFLQQIRLGKVDPIIEAVQRNGIQELLNRIPLTDCQLYSGTHPASALDWLFAHGYYHSMSETSKYRHMTAQYCRGNGLDIGSGGNPVVPWAIQVDLPDEKFAWYHSNEIPNNPINWRGDARNLPFKDGSMDFVYSSHLIEDFVDWMPILKEWTRVLKPGGKLIILVPDKVLWNEAIRNGQPPNCQHTHESYVGELSTYADRIGVKVEMEQLTALTPEDYSILFVATKK